MNVVESRKMSGFPVSISTGFAMETLFNPRIAVIDPLRVAPPRVSLANYDILSINVLTLLRNIMNASQMKEENEMFSDFKRSVDIRPEMLVEALSGEMDLIRSLCAVEGQGRIQSRFYVTDYSTFYRGKGPEYKLRVPNSDKQKAWFNTVHTALRYAQNSGLPIVQGFKPERQTERNVILTHMVPDLLDFRTVANMELLESHTGRVKTRREWNTKYQPMGTEKFENLPFCKPLLCYLGDKYVLQPLSITIRKTLQDLSIERRWTPMTSESTVYMDCMTKIKNQDIVKVLRQITLY